jgi:uncharacterized protein (DUF2164 family)
MSLPVNSLFSLLKNYTLKKFELDIGNLPAQSLFNFIIEEFRHHFYNEALNDISEWLTERFAYLNEDLVVLSKEKLNKKKINKTCNKAV